MSDVSAWLGSRRPAPPANLEPWLLIQDDGPGSVHEALTAAGRRELDRARARPGPVRESALHLLAADALITYACEAALAAPDRRAALSGVLHVVASPGAAGA